MEPWLYITFYVCLYGCFKEIRPASHFLTQYLEGPWVNLTHSQVNNEVYPVWTYSYLTLLPVVFLLTVFVRYKPFIILESAALVLTWILLTWGEGLLTMQIMQATFGLATASDIAYYTYIYAKVPKSKYRKITSFTRAAVWVGRLLSAILAQVLVSTHAMDYFTLNYLSLACVLFALLLALFLPTTSSPTPTSSSDNLDAEAKTHLRDHDDEKEEEGRKQNGGVVVVDIIQMENGKPKFGVNEDKVQEKGATKVPYRDLEGGYTSMVLHVVEELKCSYRDLSILQWSVWWALATCGNYQVSNYVQPLWEEIYPAELHGNLYHGAASAVKMALGIVVTLAMGFVKLDWNEYGEITLGLVSVVEATMLYIMARTPDIWIAYLTICCFKLLHQMLITIASYQVAKDLNQNTRPLVYGCNTFVSLILHTIFTIAVVDKRGLSLEPRPQFVVYSTYFFIMGIIFLAILTVRKCRRCRKETSQLAVGGAASATQSELATVVGGEQKC